MALVTFKAPIDRFRGTMRDLSGSGLVIYDSPKSGNVARNYTRPYNPNSLLQQAVREAFSAASQGFAALTALEAAAWNSAAAEYHRLNPLDVPYDYSGINLYVAVNTYADLANAGDPIATPPTNLAYPILNLETATAKTTIVAPQTLVFEVDIATAPAVATNQFLLVMTTEAWTTPARIPRRSDFSLRDVATIENNLATYSNIGGLSATQATNMTNSAKPVHAGDIVWFRVVPLSNDYVPAAAPVIFSLVVANV